MSPDTHLSFTYYHSFTMGFPMAQAYSKLILSLSHSYNEHLLVTFNVSGMELGARNTEEWDLVLPLRYSSCFMDSYLYIWPWVPLIPCDFRACCSLQITYSSLQTCLRASWGSELWDLSKVTELASTESRTSTCFSDSRLRSFPLFFLSLSTFLSFKDDHTDN